MSSGLAANAQGMPSPPTRVGHTHSQGRRPVVDPGRCPAAFPQMVIAGEASMAEQYCRGFGLPEGTLQVGAQAAALCMYSRGWDGMGWCGWGVTPPAPGRWWLVRLLGMLVGLLGWLGRLGWWGCWWGCWVGWGGCCWGCCCWGGWGWGWGGCWRGCWGGWGCPVPLLLLAAPASPAALSAAMSPVPPVLQH